MYWAKLVVFLAIVVYSFFSAKGFGRVFSNFRRVISKSFFCLTAIFVLYLAIFVLYLAKPFNK